MCSGGLTHIQNKNFDINFGWSERINTIRPHTNYLHFSERLRRSRQTGCRQSALLVQTVTAPPPIDTGLRNTCVTYRRLVTSPAHYGCTCTTCTTVTTVVPPGPQWRPTCQRQESENAPTRRQAARRAQQNLTQCQHAHRISIEVSNIEIQAMAATFNTTSFVCQESEDPS